MAMPRAQKIRVGVLLGVLALVGVQYLRIRRSEHQVPDWARPEMATVVLLTPPGASDDETREVDQLPRCAPPDAEGAAFRGREGCRTSEFARYSERAGFEPVHLFLLGPVSVTRMPPAIAGD